MMMPWLTSFWQWLEEGVLPGVQSWLVDSMTPRTVYWLAICVLGWSVICFVVFVLVSYWVVSALQTSLDDNGVFFYKYSRRCQRVLDAYGDAEIRRVYLVRQPFSALLNHALNVLTLFRYRSFLTPDNFPCHVALVLELRCGGGGGGGETKFVLVEKNHCVSLCENYMIHSAFDYMPISLRGRGRGWTLRALLEATRARLGDHVFFNWSVQSHNCQQFTRELLATLGCSSRRARCFIQRDQLLALVKPTDFMLHVVHCISNALNCVEKYVLDVLWVA